MGHNPLAMMKGMDLGCRLAIYSRVRLDLPCDSTRQSALGAKNPVSYILPHTWPSTGQSKSLWFICGFRNRKLVLSVTN